MGISFVGKRVLISGGTSGLGKSLALKISQDAEKVYVIGINGEIVENSRIEFLRCDYTSLKSVIDACEELAAQNYEFDILINNAGILSPPMYSETSDGYEKSYQINFLSHVLLTKLLLKEGVLNSPTIVNTSSPVYRRGTLDMTNNTSHHYTGLQAYANSKLFQALFSEKLAEEGIRSFAFNPGTFSSGIYRSQKGWFRGMYKIAAPFMVSSDRVASKLLGILETDSFSSGKIISKNGSEKSIDKFDELQKDQFWEKVYSQLDLKN